MTLPPGLGSLCSPDSDAPLLSPSSSKAAPKSRVFNKLELMCRPRAGAPSAGTDCPHSHRSWAHVAPWQVALLFGCHTLVGHLAGHARVERPWTGCQVLMCEMPRSTTPRSWRTREPREHAQRALPTPRTGATWASPGVPGTPPATWLRPRAGVSTGCPAAQTFLTATLRWPEQNVLSPSAHAQTADPAYFFSLQLLRPLQVTVPTGSPAQAGGRDRPSSAPSSSAVRACCWAGAGPPQPPSARPH